MSMSVADLGELLTAPAAGAVDCHPVLAGGHSEWSLLRLPPDATWTAPDADLEERALLMLQGFATIEVDALRQSVGSGHLLIVDAGATLTVHNDHTTPLSAVVVVSPRSRARAAATSPIPSAPQE